MNFKFNNQLIDRKMKKILFCAGLVALAASCTQDETLSLDTQKASKGLTFEFVNGVDSRIQYEKDGEVWKPFWYAEQDRITLWATGVTTQDWNSGESKWDVTTVNEGEWSAFASSATAVTYKATKSERNAQFTSIDDENLLTGFSYDEETAKFLAVYPANTDYKLSDGQEGTLDVEGALAGLATQTISTSKGHNPAIVQLAHAEVSEHESYNSVGEKVTLRYSFATPVVKFGTEGLTNDYKTAFGNLKSVTLTMKGYDTEGTEDDIPASIITYEEPTIAIDLKNWNHAIVEGGQDGGASEIKATIGGETGLEWSDDALAPIAVADVDRTAFAEAGVAETYTAVYEFANIELNAGGDNKVKTTNKSWNHGGSFLTVHLKMNEFSYLVTKTPADESDSRTLFVIKGDFSDILTSDKAAINWYDTESGLDEPVPFTDITKVVVESGVTLDAEDFVVLNKMKNVKDLTLTSNTSIPAEALVDLTKLKIINLPAVTSVGEGAFAADLTHVYMPSYAFESKSINDMLLKASSLKKLDMSGASVMNAGFPAKGLLLSNFDLLTEVTVKDGIKVGSNAFENCDELTTINGRLDIIGDAALQNCIKLNNVIVSSKDVRKNTFNGCRELANVYYMNAETALVPNEVKDNAFKGTKVDLDLSATTTIGEYAFANNLTMKGVAKDNDKDVVLVGATTIGDNAFNGNAEIGYIYFKNATLIGDAILDECTGLNEIKFGAKFSYSKAGENPSEDTFGEKATREKRIKLFHVNGQTGVENDVLNFGNSATPVKFKFYQITEEEAY